MIEFRNIRDEPRGRIWTQSTNGSIVYQHFHKFVFRFCWRIVGHVWQIYYGIKHWGEKGEQVGYQDRKDSPQKKKSAFSKGLTIRCHGKRLSCDSEHNVQQLFPGHNAPLQRSQNPRLLRHWLLPVSPKEGHLGMRTFYDDLLNGAACQVFLLVMMELLENSQGLRMESARGVENWKTVVRSLYGSVFFIIHTYTQECYAHFRHKILPTRCHLLVSYDDVITGDQWETKKSPNWSVRRDRCVRK